MVEEVKPDLNKYKFRKSPEFKLKDKQGRNYIAINLRDFGFLPETIIIQKIHGQANKFYIIALLTPEEMKKEEEKKKSNEILKVQNKK